MSGEQRVTDDFLEQLLCPVTALGFPRAAIDAFEDLRDSRAAHRATEAKLRAASAELERLKKSRDSYKDDCARWKREAESNGRMEIEERALKEAAESALAATKAKLEALNTAATETLKAYGALQDDYSSYSPYWTELERATDRLLAAALTTKETTDAN